MKSGIFVEAVPVISDKKFPYINLVTGPKWHAYLVYRDGNGNARVIRGHPEGSGENFAPPSGAMGNTVLGGNLALEVDKPLQDSRDAYKPGETPETRRSRRLDIGDRDPAAVWADMVAQGRKLANTEMEYDTHVFEPSQNSNSVVRSVQKAAGIPLDNGLPKGLSKDDLPGFTRDLSNPRGPARSRREQEQTQREFDEQTRSFRDWEEKRRQELNPKRGPGGAPRPAPGAAGVRARREVPQAPGHINGTSEDPAATEGRALQQKIAASPQTPQEILAKPFRKVTEDEIGQLIGADGYWERGMPLHGKLQDYVRGWMDDAYGTGPLQYDGAG